MGLEEGSCCRGLPLTDKVVMMMMVMMMMVKQKVSPAKFNFSFYLEEQNQTSSKTDEQPIQAAREGTRE